MLSRVENFAENDAVAAQQHPADGFERARAVGGLVDVEQRPAAGAVARARVRPVPWPARRLGSISARRLSKPSAVSIPAVTSSHRAVSTSALSLPVPRTMSGKKEAPRCCRNA